MWGVTIHRHSLDKPFRFADLIAHQDEMLQQLRPVKGSAILFAEVAPTVTFGARQIHVEAEQERFKKQGFEIISGERGGNETWHGPGQWVGFVLTPLEIFTGDSKGVRKAVYQILENVLPIAKQYLPETRFKDGADLGLWSNLGKVASVGIKIRNGYTSSGFALNCVPNDAAFMGISPCGIADARPDFIFRESIAPANYSQEFEKIPHLILESFLKNQR